MSWPVQIPPAPATNPVLNANDRFQFTASAPCTICFGAPLQNVAPHTFATGETWGPPVPRPPQGTEIPFNVVTTAPDTCTVPPIQTGHVIIIGS
jgi:hypothetical protein